ncbi:uncharacterized protein NPIL_285801 [Nephila pilipes]|uniref:Uncharacterized protein n=1 Tax=Nephila pilipes TaxID=299642 RepID=A0A8X6QRH0_NEPPI|nr:uncharacterized protein NPIL_605831 [Nephila pilipes]GFT65026.1 uncharacterized protein NPIL_498671 [Nephila pilipes]GFT95322.1 uncharacterized protein NPIL_244941 [Nephila pilipes]GFU40411.1 uncharacterized protein NPIL_285801 [Nephila pilipes]
MLFVPPLKVIAAVPFVVTLCNDSEMQQFFKKTEFCLSPDEEWKVIMKKKMPNDVYPLPLQEKFMNLMKPIHYEFEMWKEQHGKFIGKNFDQRIINKIHWKSDGTIDRLKTASFLIQSDVLPMKHRFRLACNYWQEESVLSIWEQMSAGFQDDFQEVQMHDIPQRLASLCSSDINVTQWIRWYSERNTTNTRQKERFWAYNWDIVSLQGLLTEKLTPKERLQIIQYVIHRNYSPHAGRFCVLLMKADQRLEVLKINPYPVLESFLLWPGQRLFIEMANHVKNDLTKDHFLCLLHIIFCQRILPNFEDFDYFELLREFWLLIPNECKNFLKGFDIYEPIALIVSKGRLELPALQKYLLHEQRHESNTRKCCMRIRYIKNLEYFRM